MHCKRLPQGLKRCSGTCQRIVNNIFGDRKGLHVLAFLNDFGIPNITEENHIASSASILDILLEAGVRLRLSKCSFRIRTAEVLGHVVEGGDLRPLQKYTNSVSKLVKRLWWRADEVFAPHGLFCWLCALVHRKYCVSVRHLRRNWAHQDKKAWTAACYLRLELAVLTSTEESKQGSKRRADYLDNTCSEDQRKA